MGAEPQRGAQDNLVQDGRAAVDDQMTAPRRLHDAPQVARVHLPDRDSRLLSQEAARAIRVPVAARNVVTLADQEPREQRAGGAGPENEDAHLRTKWP